MTFAQLGQLPLDKVIDNIKPCIIAIEARDDTVLAIQNNDTIRYSSYGSGVIIFLDSNNVYALTNEHVVAIKNQTNNKTIRYAKNIMVSYNVKGFGAISFPAQIRKVDEDLDLVALRVFTPKELRDSLEVLGLPVKMWQEEKFLKEGEIVLYSGYPLMLGREERNYPLTRTGMISQLIPNQNTFLIDSFVQSGYSGSPVFVIRPLGNSFPTTWEFKFVGLTSGFPYQMVPVYQKVQYIQIPKCWSKGKSWFFSCCWGFGN